MQEMFFVSFLPFPAWLSTCPTVVWGSYNPGPMAANLENASCTQHWSWRHELLEIWCTHCPSFTSANPIGERVNIRSTVLSCMKSSLSSLWRGHARLIIMDFLNVYSGFPPASAFCCQCNPPESHHWSLAFERTTWLEIIHWSNDKLFGNYLYTSMRGRRKGRVAFKRLSRLGQARLRHVFGLRTGALFFFLGGSKGAVLDPPNVLFFAVPEFESCWGSAVSQPCPRRCFCSRISYGAGRQSFYTASIHLSPTLCF